MNIKNTTHVELCPRCRASIALTPYTRLPFEEDISRAYRNPSKTDSCAIEGSLTSPIAELATLAEEIQRVEAMLNALKKHHAQLEGHIHRTTRYIQSSPIRQLPTEILVVIFASACTSFQEWEYKTPLSISLVCSKWRDIAMSKPTLWTNIYVAPYSKAYGIPVFKYYLQRCGGIPLSVKVEIPVRARACLDDYDVDTPYEDHYGFRTTTSAHRLVEPIFATFPQWKVADFHMKQADLELLDNHCSNQKFPLLLESLTLATHHPQMDDLPRILCQAPLLSSLTLVDRDESVGLLWMYSGLPWRQLRQIRANRLLAANSIFIDNFPDGENRTIIITTLPTEADFSPGPYNSVFTGHVTSLILDGLYWDRCTSTLFKAIAIPSLKELSIIDAGSFRWRDQFLVLAGFLARSRCTLNALSLVVLLEEGRDNQRTELADDLVDLLHNMGHLNHLQVVEAGSGPPLLNERFSRELLGNILLPELTSVELVWAEDRQPDRELLTALSSRADGTLSSVVLGIRNGGNLKPEVLECMRGLRQKNVQATCW